VSDAERDLLEPPSDFVQEVRSALDHLYDQAYLLSCPLTNRLVVDLRLDHLSRVQQARRALLHCIEALHPQMDAGSDGTRAYSVLMYRCVDGLAMPAVAAKLALSERQVYREYAKGIEAVARLLWAKVLSRLGEQALPSIAGPDVPSDRLALAKAEAERLQAETSVELVSPTAVLRSVCALFAPRTQQTGIDIVLAAPDPCPQVVADRTLLRQALLSLLSHALDTVADSVQVRVSILDAEEIQITVSGTLREHSPSVPAQPRREVGLAVAHMLIKGQGGDLYIEVHDQLWQGRLLLPTARTVTILVVDDNSGIRALFQRFLAGHKVAAIGATSGPQAVQLASELHPHLIFLDLMMPHQDGWETLQELKRNPATHAIPVVVCSVLNERDLALGMGASDYLTKPVSQSALVEVLRRWLGRLHPLV
jgi:CheY-like chemotaxis protein